MAVLPLYADVVSMRRRISSNFFSTLLCHSGCLHIARSCKTPTVLSSTEALNRSYWCISKIANVDCRPISRHTAETVQGR